MTAESFLQFASALPHVVQTELHGRPAFWVGAQADGGKMFAVLSFEARMLRGQPQPIVLSLAVGEERYHSLLELQGVFPAPYLARAFWVAFERWDVLTDRGFREQIEHAHTRTFDRLPRRLQTALTQPRRSPSRATR